MKLLESYKKTEDDWYGNWNTDEVRLSLNALHDGRFRVCCWGNDDFGIEHDFDVKSEALAVYEKLNAMDVINHDDLYEMGFVVF